MDDLGLQQPAAESERLGVALQRKAAHAEVEATVADQHQPAAVFARGLLHPSGQAAKGRRVGRAGFERDLFVARGGGAGRRHRTVRGEPAGLDVDIGALTDGGHGIADLGRGHWLGDPLRQVLVNPFLALDGRLVAAVAHRAGHLGDVHHRHQRGGHRRWVEAAQGVGQAREIGEVAEGTGVGVDPIEVELRHGRLGGGSGLGDQGVVRVRHPLDGDRIGSSGEPGRQGRG